jgi:hypothetical protein
MAGEILALRNALITIINGDATVQGITGKANLSLVPRFAPVHPEATPIMTYYIVFAPKKGGTAGRRDVLIQIEAWTPADSDTSISDMDTMLDRAETLITHNLLEAQSVDAAVNAIINRGDGGVENGVRSSRIDVRLELTI